MIRWRGYNRFSEIYETATAGWGFEHLDYLILSGDLTNHGSAEEFDRVYRFVSELIKRFELSAGRCVIVPGNHDLSWETEVYDWQSSAE